jgi:hypothetical protein
MTEPGEALTPEQIAALLRSGADAVRAEVAALPPTLARFRPGPAEWCALEVVGHLSEAERRGFAGRIRQVLAAGTPPRLISWDPAEVARGRRDDAKPASAVLDEFLSLRAASVGLVAGLGGADLARAGDHPTVGRLTVRDLLYEWVHHDRNHLRQILANVQAFAWPHMGNAQRFSAP